MIDYKKDKFYFSLLSGYAVRKYYTEVLGLRGSELQVYSVIASFSENDNCEGVFTGSMDYLSSLTGISVATARRAVAKLLAKKLIVRDDHQDSPHRITVAYYADLALAEDELKKYVDAIGKLHRRCKHPTLLDEYREITKVI